eukprot:scaffold286_cov247-Pinguiococcus_pyrenoidosus.AAC.15
MGLGWLNQGENRAEATRTEDDWWQNEDTPNAGDQISSLAGMDCTLGQTLRRLIGQRKEL